jgi:hypothetical protein
MPAATLEPREDLVAVTLAPREDLVAGAELASCASSGCPNLTVYRVCSWCRRPELRRTGPQEGPP